jgi:internalin A
MIEFAGKSYDPATTKQIKASRKAVEDLSPLAQLPNLTSLKLDNVSTTDLSPLSNLTKLTDLSLANSAVTDLRPLAPLRLKRLDIYKTNVADLSPLADMTSLRDLEASSTKVVDASPLANLVALEKVALCCYIADLAFVTKLAALRELRVMYSHVEDIAPLVHARSLVKLDLGSSPFLRFGEGTLKPRLFRHIEVLGELVKLESLDLGATGIVDLAPLAPLVKLTWLSLEDTAVRDISVLARLTKLRDLNLGRTEIADLTPIANLPLRWFSLYGAKVNEEQADCAAAVRSQRGLVAVDTHGVVGFLTWETREGGAEITWMAVRANARRCGFGRALLGGLVDRLRVDAVTELRVKTLSSRDPYPPYAETRAFYRANGFEEIDELDIWGPENPVVLLARRI